MRAQDRGGLAHRPCAFLRRRVAPCRKRGARCSDGAVDIFASASTTLPSASPVAGSLTPRKRARSAGVPAAAVEQVAMRRQRHASPSGKPGLPCGRPQLASGGGGNVAQQRRRHRARAYSGATCTSITHTAPSCTRATPVGDRLLQIGDGTHRPEADRRPGRRRGWRDSCAGRPCAIRSSGFRPDARACGPPVPDAARR